MAKLVYRTGRLTPVATFTFESTNENEIRVKLHHYDKTYTKIVPTLQLAEQWITTQTAKLTREQEHEA